MAEEAALLILSKKDEKLIANARAKSIDRRKSASSPKLREVFSKLGGIKGAIDLARNAAHENPQMETLVTIWDDLLPEERKGLEIEELCGMANIRSGDFIGILAKTAWEINRPLADFVVAMSVPKLAQVSVDMALDGEKGFKDREALLRKAGIHPDKQSLVQVNQNNQTLVQTTNALPSFEADAHRFDKLLNGAVEGEIIDEEGS